MSDDYDVPLTLKSSLSRSDFEVKSIEISYGRQTRTQKFKFRFPIYKNQENQEILLKLLREFQRQIDRNALWSTIGEAKVYDAFQQCLEGDALDTWFDVVQDEEEMVWEDNLAELVERLIGEEVYDQQRDYMLEIKNLVTCQLNNG